MNRNDCQIFTGEWFSQRLYKFVRFVLNVSHKDELFSDLVFHVFEIFPRLKIRLMNVVHFFFTNKMDGTSVVCTRFSLHHFLCSVTKLLADEELGGDIEGVEKFGCWGDTYGHIPGSSYAVCGCVLKHVVAQTTPEVYTQSVLLGLHRIEHVRSSEVDVEKDGIGDYA